MSAAVWGPRRGENSVELAHDLQKNCHAERSGEENEVILAAQSKHPYPFPAKMTFDYFVTCNS